jgi:hypothetical protein
MIMGWLEGAHLRVGEMLPLAKEEIDFVVEEEKALAGWPGERSK